MNEPAADLQQQEVLQNISEFETRCHPNLSTL